MTTLHRLRAALAALLAAVLLTACGNSGDTSSKDDSAKDSSTSQTSEQSDDASNGTWDAEPMTKEDLGKRMVEAQRKAETFHLQMTQDVGGTKQETSADGRVKGNTTEMSMKTGDGSQEVVVKDGFTYIKSAVLQTEKPWLKIDPKASTGIGKMMGDLGGNSDPAKLSEVFAKAVSVKATDKVETTDGVDTMMYKLSLPSAAITENLGLPAEFTKMMPKTIDYDVWVDEADRMRKMNMQMEVMGQKTTTEMVFSKYGEDVTIEAPPADQVTTKEPAMPGVAN